MTVKGRTLTQRQHRVGGKLDPEVHGVVFYPTAPVPKPPDVPEPKYAQLSGRPGAAERTMELAWFLSRDRGGMVLEIEHTGWYESHIELDERQARFLRDALNDWFPD